ncbi:MAG: hypothetical protein NVSMB27_39710 [Ktedonobacteraceae bacterium]
MRVSGAVGEQGIRQEYPYHGPTRLRGHIVHGRDTPRGYPGQGANMLHAPYKNRTRTYILRGGMRDVAPFIAT